MAADQRGEDTAESPTVHLESGGSVDGALAFGTGSTGCRYLHPDRAGKCIPPVVRWK